MSTKNEIRSAYDKVAEQYGAQFWNEFEKKPFDRMLLDWYAANMPAQAEVLEIGCGPGEVSGYLHKAGVRCTGTDFSEKMIINARKYFPQVSFEVQDFFDMRYNAASYYGVVAFYAIVNLTLEEVRRVFTEVKRIMKPGGLFVFSFHILEEIDRLDVDDFFEVKFNPVTFYFFNVDEIKKMVEELGFRIADVLIRYPYPEVEYASKRAYFVLSK